MVTPRMASNAHGSRASKSPPSPPGPIAVDMLSNESPAAKGSPRECSPPPRRRIRSPSCSCNVQPGGPRKAPATAEGTPGSTPGSKDQDKSCRVPRKPGRAMEDPRPSGRRCTTAAGSLTSVITEPVTPLRLDDGPPSARRASSDATTATPSSSLHTPMRAQPLQAAATSPVSRTVVPAAAAPRLGTQVECYYSTHPHAEAVWFGGAGKPQALTPVRLRTSYTLAGKHAPTLHRPALSPCSLAPASVTVQAAGRLQASHPVLATARQVKGQLLSTVISSHVPPATVRQAPLEGVAAFCTPPLSRQPSRGAP